MQDLLSSQLPGVFRYDLAEDSWLELPPMNTARALAGSVVYKNNIYVIGGNSSISTKWRKELLPEHCVGTVEIFDPAEGTWRMGPELPNALCGAGKYQEFWMEFAVPFKWDIKMAKTERQPVWDKAVRSKIIQAV